MKENPHGSTSSDEQQSPKPSMGSKEPLSTEDQERNTKLWLSYVNHRQILRNNFHSRRSSAGLLVTSDDNGVRRHSSLNRDARRASDVSRPTIVRRGSSQMIATVLGCPMPAVPDFDSEETKQVAHARSKSSF